MHLPETWGHFVQFYEHDGFLTENISHLAAETLRVGNSTILVATAAHLGDIEQRLAGCGFDLKQLRSEGRYVACDAEATLARLLIGGWPNAGRFQDIIGGTIKNAIDKSANRFVFAFGEMVALLCAANKADAALRLERLWNSLNATHRFSLCCAYPLSSFAHKSGAVLVFEICAEHSLAIPAEMSF
jgi:hypothetical protein